MHEAEQNAESSGAARPKLGQRWGWLLIMAAAALGLGVSSYLCAPGYLAIDSSGQLEQARAFQFKDDHPVVVALIWHYLDRLVPGPLGMFMLNAGLYWAGIGGLFWALQGPAWLRALAVLTVGFYPPVFSCLPSVMKDALMHGALLAGLVFLVAPTRRARAWRVGAGLLFLLFAIGVRHNAAAAALPFVAVAVLLLLPIRQRWLRLLAAGALGLVLTYGFTRALQHALQPMTQRMEFWQSVPTFDLAGMSHQANEVLIEPETTVFNHRMRLKHIRALYTVEYGPQLYYCVTRRNGRCLHVFQRTRDAEQLRQLTNNWLRAIRQHPGAYLAHRYEFSRTLLTLNRMPNKKLYYLEAFPHHPLSSEYPPTERNRRVMGWIERELKGRAYQPWIYAFLCVAFIPVGLFRYARSGQLITLALALSGSCYLLSVLLSATSTDYRYTVWTITCAVLALSSVLFSSPVARLATSVTARAASVLRRRRRDTGASSAAMAPL